MKAYSRGIIDSIIEKVVRLVVVIGNVYAVKTINWHTIYVYIIKKYQLICAALHLQHVLF